MYPFTEIETPALLVDVDRAERNLARVADDARRQGLAVWPHTKTHKTPAWARRQLDLGAQGLTVAKLGEAEVMVAAGLPVIQIFYPLLGASASRRLADLLRKGAQLRVVLDSEASLATVAEAARSASASVDILVEVDTGMHRVGVAGPEEALAIARAAEKASGVEFVGLASFAGHVGHKDAEEQRLAVLEQEASRLRAVRQRIEGAGIPVSVVSVGGTHHAARMAEIHDATEIRPGTYIYNDRATVLAGSATWDTCAATVLATVVSVHRDWVIVDAGSKALASDSVPAGGHGAVLGHPEWEVAALSEEHGTLRLRPDRVPAGEGESTPLPRLGERVQVVPNHICTVVNLFDGFYATRGESVLYRMDIAGRGRSQ